MGEVTIVRSGARPGFVDVHDAESLMRRFIRYRDALMKLQRPVKRSKGDKPVMFCTECGKRWPVGEAEDHWPTCATGISRMAFLAPDDTAVEPGSMIHCNDCGSTWPSNWPDWAKEQAHFPWCEAQLK